jgi:hypothetical protein
MTNQNIIQTDFTATLRPDDAIRCIGSLKPRSGGTVGDAPSDPEGVAVDTPSDPGHGAQGDPATPRAPSLVSGVTTHRQGMKQSQGQRGPNRFVTHAEMEIDNYTVVFKMTKRGVVVRRKFTRDLPAMVSLRDIWDLVTGQMMMKL